MPTDPHEDESHQSAAEGDVVESVLQPAWELADEIDQAFFSRSSRLFEDDPGSTDRIAKFRLRAEALADHSAAKESDLQSVHNHLMELARGHFDAERVGAWITRCREFIVEALPGRWAELNSLWKAAVVLGRGTEEIWTRLLRALRHADYDGIPVSLLVEIPRVGDQLRNILDIDAERDPRWLQVGSPHCRASDDYHRPRLTDADLVQMRWSDFPATEADCLIDMSVPLLFQPRLRLTAAGRAEIARREIDAWSQLQLDIELQGGNVALYGQGEPVRVLRTRKPPLTPARYEVIRKLIELVNQDPTKWHSYDFLSEQSGHNARDAIRNVCDEDPDWRAVIESREGRGAGHRMRTGPVRPS